jgi:AcrR family transcriptional regulator
MNDPTSRSGKHMPGADAVQAVNRGSQTRRHLLRAGLELFGQRDYDNVTTRQLADLAGANLAAIPYHFGTKQALYQAVAEDIVASIQPSTRAALLTAGRCADTPDAGAHRLLQALREVILVFSHEVVGVADARLRAGYILREQLRPSASFDVLYEGFMRELHSVMTRLHARLLGCPDEDPAMAFRCQCLIGQVLGFRVGREVLLRRLNRDTLDPRQIAEFVADTNVAALQREIGHA